MNQTVEQTMAQTMVDAIIGAATLAETGRIAALARQGLEDSLSLTIVQARHVFAAFLLLFDPLVAVRGEEAPGPLFPRIGPPPQVPLLQDGCPA